MHFALHLKRARKPLPIEIGVASVERFQRISSGHSRALLVAVQAGALSVSQPPTPGRAAVGDPISMRLSRANSDSFVAPAVLAPLAPTEAAKKKGPCRRGLEA